MKYGSIYLSNYIGIYNGMKLNDIFIDFTKCRHRITIIRGDNGSGKSTLSKSLSLFPDSNDAFIPGLPAKKEITLIDNDVVYKLVFVHDIKSNGERDTTKAYITKTFNGTAIELNENGNVSSYKDILYSELGLDANFAALSQLSNEDRGLADKKPAERKRFVNSIISSLDTYNNIYKILTKRSSNFKSLINAVVAKLNMLGDDKTLQSKLEYVEAKITELRNIKDAAINERAEARALFVSLDPDGSITAQNKEAIDAQTKAQAEQDKINSVIGSILASDPNLDKTNPEDGFKKATDRITNLKIQNQIDNAALDGLITQKEVQTAEVERKISKLRSLESEHTFEELKDTIAIYEAELDEIRDDIEKSVGIKDISSISKNEYIIALNSLNDLSQSIQSFKSFASFSLIESIISEYLETGTAAIVNPEPYDEKVDLLDKKGIEISKEITALQAEAKIVSTLSSRPAECTIDHCPFIKDAFELSQKDPNGKLAALTKDFEATQGELELAFKDAHDIKERNEVANRFMAIVREINKNASLLAKFPHGELFEDKRKFFERFMAGDNFEYMSELYKYLDYANMFDKYKTLMQMCDKYREEIKVYEGKAAAIDSINEDIDSINATLSRIADKIEPMKAAIFNREAEISQLEHLCVLYNSLFDNLEKLKVAKDEIDRCRSILLVNSDKMNTINGAIEVINRAETTILSCDRDLDPFMKERDSVKHSIQMMIDYKKEKEELEQEHKYIETIKYYASPTTGIQLIFMQLYMGKIIELSNQLLSLLFGGQFVIQPFVINESEFRIPCLGSGYLNDDISSMSSSQIGMISMILSCAMLYHSSTKYNILKLDEIDGPLDYNNRIMFMEVLNSIMDIMHTEQCIMISHNSELQVDNSDVILLKHDTTNTEYQRGNIIWRY